MIILPPGAFMVLQDQAEKKDESTRPSLVLSMDELDKKPERPNTGIITFTSQELNEYQGCKVKVRLGYADPEVMIIQGEEYLFFRDFNSSIYYVTRD